MSTLCRALHQLVGCLPVFSIPFVPAHIPKNGIYFLFEDGEKTYDADRIVRVGTHTGTNQLRSRLAQHFVNENKDRSIFRKNIGRALLARANDPFLSEWNLDLTPAAARRLHGSRVDFTKQTSIESAVTAYMRSHFRFATIAIDSKDQRLLWESRIISTLSHCENCRPSPDWLGNFSPHKKIRESGLWQVNELYKTPFSMDEFREFERAVL
jgi:hypothetical protein